MIGHPRVFIRRLFYAIRMIIYKHKGLCYGENVKIRGGIFFDKASQVVIGNNSFINRGCQFHIGAEPSHKIYIGNNVFVGMNVCFITYSHEFGPCKQRAAQTIYDDIVIEDGVWIGGNVTILPGVTIGRGSIIASGSIVCKSLDGNVLYAGVPAKKIKELS